jgi:hypothetical protein
LQRIRVGRLVRALIEVRNGYVLGALGPPDLPLAGQAVLGERLLAGDLACRAPASASDAATQRERHRVAPPENLGAVASALVPPADAHMGPLARSTRSILTLVLGGGQLRSTLPRGATAAAIGVVLDCSLKHCEGAST